MTDSVRSENFTNEQLVEEYGVDLSIEFFDDSANSGYVFKIGDRVRVVEDDESAGVYEDDEGKIVGFWHREATSPDDEHYHQRVGFGTAHETTKIIVEWDENDEPISVEASVLEAL